MPDLRESRVYRVYAVILVPKEILAVKVPREIS